MTILEAGPQICEPNKIMRQELKGKAGKQMIM